MKIPTNEDQSVSDKDKEIVRWAYKLFLDREAENEHVLNRSFKNTKELRKDFMTSSEFINNLAKDKDLMKFIHFNIENRLKHFTSSNNTNNSINNTNLNNKMANYNANSILSSPKVIPLHMINDYTMNGKIDVKYQNIDDKSLNLDKLHNKVETYETVFNQLNNREFRYFETKILSLLQALDKYSINDMNVLIWGLSGCNCEAISLWKGARKVYVIDKNKPICDNNKIFVLDTKELSEETIFSDFAISLSTFDYEGLNGDQLSPYGDLDAMKRAHEHLLNNGLLFLSVPLGLDCIVWNRRRIYGKHRLPILLKGWELLDIFDTNEMSTPDYPFDLELGNYIQNILVLRKLDTDYPDDKILLRKIPLNNMDNPNINKMYENINKFIFDFKHEKNKTPL